MKLSKLLDSYEALSELSRAKMNMPMAFKISKIIKQIDEEIRLFNQASTKIRKQFVDEDGGIDAENQEKYRQEVEAVLEEDVTIHYQRIPMSEFNNVTISPRHLTLLDWLITE